MLQTLEIIKFVFPFVELCMFFCLYRKTYNFMKRFYCNMTLFRNARKFYSLCVLIVLFFINWCCCMTDQNYAVGLSVMMIVLCFSYRVSDYVLSRLKANKVLFFATMVISMICFAIPYLNSLFHVFYTIGIASVFYPSAHLLKIPKEEWMAMDKQMIQKRILKEYN